MGLTFGRTVSVRIRQPEFLYWADYKWNEARQLWIATDSNEGFYRRFTEFNSTMTDSEMMLLAVKFDK